MRIAVIGTGSIGGTLGRAFARAGHDVTFGSRSPGSDPVSQDTAARVTDAGSALDGAEVVALALPGPAVDGLLAEHADALAGRLVLDCANRIGGAGPANSHDGGAGRAVCPGVQLHGLGESRRPAVRRRAGRHVLLRPGS